MLSCFPEISPLPQCQLTKVQEQGWHRDAKVSSSPWPCHGGEERGCWETGLETSGAKATFVNVDIKYEESSENTQAEIFLFQEAGATVTQADFVCLLAYFCLTVWSQGLPV